MLSENWRIISFVENPRFTQGLVCRQANCQLLFFPVPSWVVGDWTMLQPLKSCRPWPALDCRGQPGVTAPSSVPVSSSIQGPLLQKWPCHDGEQSAWEEMGLHLSCKLNSINPTGCSLNMLLILAWLHTLCRCHVWSTMLDTKYFTILKPEELQQFSSRKSGEFVTLRKHNYGSCNRQLKRASRKTTILYSFLCWMSAWTKSCKLWPQRNHIIWFLRQASEGVIRSSILSCTYRPFSDRWVGIVLHSL